MELRKRLNWYIEFEGRPTAQALYYSERPAYEFRKKMETRGGKSILVADKNPTWKPIVLEIPTQPIELMAEWLTERDKRNIVMKCVEPNGKLVEQWYIMQASVTSQQVRPGRMMPSKVLAVVLNYDWARKA